MKNLWARSSKYGNRRIIVGGETFDSEREYRRYCELKLLEQAGEIKNLARQEKFVLIPTQRIREQLIEKECSYRADFTYWEETAEGCWQKVVEDAKGCRTEVYKIKKKLMLWVHGIRIREV